jgi:hypothetical protein
MSTDPTPTPPKERTIQDLSVPELETAVERIGDRLESLRRTGAKQSRQAQHYRALRKDAKEELQKRKEAAGG